MKKEKERERERDEEGRMNHGLFVNDDTHTYTTDALD